MGYLDYAGLQYLWGKLKEKFAPKSHSHDDRYYTEAEMDGKLNSKVNNNEAGADSLLSKLTTSWTATPTDNTYFIRQDTGGGDSFGRVKFSTLWNYIKGKADGVYQLKGSYAASEHTHDDRYYTEAEIDGKLTEKLHEETITDARDLNTIKTTGVYHLKTTSYTNGPGISNHATIFVDYTVGTPYQIFIPDSVNRAWRRNHVNSNNTWSAWTELKYTDTNTWRGIQNNLTSDSTSDSLSAAQGKALKTLIDGKAASVHTHTKDQVGLGNVDNTADANKSVKYATSAGSANTATKATTADSANYLSGLSSRSSQSWGVQTGTFIHGEGDGTGGDFAFRRDCPNAGQISMILDGRFYQNEGQYRVLDESDKNQFATAGHTHNYAGSSSAGGSATSAVKLDSSAGSNTQPVYFSGGKPVAIGYTIAKSVPADAKFTDTNTWRGIQNNLTSDSTDQSLSAAQGKALKALVDGKAPTSHKHTKSQITDFPSSMPASDVYAWAKAATKPSYTKAEVGLGNVDNTADKDKSVKHAASAESATTGLNGVSTCIFDSSSNNGSCVRFYNGLQICFGNSSKSSGVVFKLPFANDNYAVVVGGSDTLKNAWYVAGSRTTTGFNPNQSGFAVLFHWIAIGNWK